MSLLLIIFIGVFNLVLVSGQYKINEGAIPSNLYRKFNYIKEDVFPHDIGINMSLSRIVGTLLYSVDKRMNQLIVSLNVADVPILVIEFNKQQSYVSLPKLCRCERCRFEPVDLRIQMRHVIYVQCNGGEVMVIGINGNRDINRDYPMMYTESEVNTYSTNEAHLWLVNTPQFGKLYPNGAQLSGCIFDVWYNNVPIIFTNITANIGRSCNKTCTTDICNGGQCCETYNTRPICNCTSTFKNGDNCDNNISKWNVRSVSQYFTFDTLKLSWMSDVNTIMELRNERMSIQLTRSGGVLSLNYEYTNGVRMTVQSNITKNYIPNNKYILILQFLEDAMYSKIFNNGTWNYSRIPTIVDLRREIFDYLSLRSGQGILDIVYKNTPREHKWRPFVIYNKEEFPPDNDVTVSSSATHVDKQIDKNGLSQSELIYIVVIYALSVPVIVSILVLVSFFRMRRWRI